ncbi:HNH endonuclease signature motif containing protein [Arthrobacter cryoconiti]|uniref:DUF222 domain-containing protein n=1 Tax=Arthrobacter cryoconiti TaxID=748907 RepID=A0ABV8R3J4_9MICC|nr:HNH endonuclease signature motif containing protein [Arthrobacter cryoconiti]MCC9067947.1 HNH endonuclease [Arthrobacter cryoconiti]
MSIRERTPGKRGEDTTADVAALITALTLPSIEPFDSDTAILAGLPAYFQFPTPAKEQSLSDPTPAELTSFEPPSFDPPSKVSVARGVYDRALAGLAAIKRLENATAACKASLVAQFMGAASVEATALTLDSWQRNVAESSAIAEIALTLSIPERTATTLVHHSTELITGHPDTLAALGAGVLSWRHAATIIDETWTLSTTPGVNPPDVAEFESRLLKLAPGTSATGFASKARRLREGTHPESLITRTKEAISKREMTLEPSKDGMSWLTLHLPAPAAEGIWVHCTRAARRFQHQPENSDQNRTLTQLRVDVATALLLGQHGLPHPGTHLTPVGMANPARPTVDPAGRHPDSCGASGHPDNGEASGHPVSCGASGHPDSGGASSTDCDNAIGDGSGYVDGFVDGVEEDPLGEYLKMLATIRAGRPITEPPPPTAQIIVTVPVLALLGITNEPAELAGYGPIAEETARKLLANTPTFLRVLTDPITNKPLDIAPDRYRLRNIERTMLNALAQTCSWPNCTTVAVLSELDHLKAWEDGGKSTSSNEHTLCKHHHTLKHFKDDKDKRGCHRQDRDPGRAGIRLRGWKPINTVTGGIAWTSPSGKYHPSPPPQTGSPSYPKWLKKLICTELPTTREVQFPYGSPGGV